MEAHHHRTISCLAGFTALLAVAAGCQDAGERMAPVFDPFLQEIFDVGVAPGMAVAVVQGDELVYARGFGFAEVEAGRPVTPETLFYVASTSKSFTALAAALLAERGDLDLEAPLSTHLPALRMTPPLSADSITLRDLLTHTHGIDAGGPVTIRTAFTGEFTNDLLVEILSTYGPASSGRAFRYGNLGYNIAGLAMDATLGESWKEVLQREVFDPLGMTSTTAYRSKADAGRLAMPYGTDPGGLVRRPYAKDDANMHAAGGHLSTVLDLAKYLEAHLNAGRVDGRQVLPEAAIAETHRPQADQDRTFGPFHRHAWGLGWDIGTYDGDTLLSRFGGFNGFHSHLSFMPRHRIGVAVQVNEAGGALLANAVAAYIYDRLRDVPEIDVRARELVEDVQSGARRRLEAITADRERRAARPQTLPHPLDAYTGVFESEAFGRMEWQLVEGKLRVKMGVAESDVEVYRGDESRLRVELTGGGSVATFNFEGNRATSVSLFGGEFRRVETG